MAAPYTQLGGAIAETLNAPQPCLDFFRTYVVTRLHFWCNHAAVKTVAAATLDAEQEHILKAIALGLDMTEAWPVVRDLIVAFAPYMERRGHWEGWHAILLHAIAAVQRVGDVDGEITLTALLAKLCQRQSKPAGVVRYYRRVIRLARQTRNRYEVARACSNLGFHYIDRGHWWRSEMLCYHALMLFEGLDNNHGRAHTHNHWGLLLIRQRRWLEAEQHLQKACAHWQMLGDEHGLLRGLINLGVLMLERVQPGEALTYLEPALQQADRAGEEAEKGLIWLNMGLAHLLTGDLAAATLYSQRAEALFHDNANWLGLALVWQNFGLLCHRQEKWDDARRYFERALETQRILRNWEGELKVLLDLIEAMFTSKAWAKADTYLTEVERLLKEHHLEKQSEFAQRASAYRCSLQEHPPL